MITDLDTQSLSLLDQPLTPVDQLIFRRALADLAGLVYTPVAVRRPDGKDQPYWFRCTVIQPMISSQWESLIQIQTPTGGNPFVSLIQPNLASLVN